jgi:hypothetical protein
MAENDSGLEVKEAIKQAEEDAEVLQAAIIHGHLQPTELAAALAALQRQALTNVRLLTTVGDDKFVTKASVRPYIAVLIFLAGTAVTTLFTFINGRLS